MGTLKVYEFLNLIRFGSLVCLSGLKVKSIKLRLKKYIMMGNII